MITRCSSLNPTRLRTFYRHHQLIFIFKSLPLLHMILFTEPSDWNRRERLKSAEEVIFFFAYQRSRRWRACSFVCHWNLRIALASLYATLWSGTGRWKLYVFFFNLLSSPWLFIKLNSWFLFPYYLVKTIVKLFNIF